MTRHVIPKLLFSALSTENTYSGIPELKKYTSTITQFSQPVFASTQLKFVSFILPADSQCYPNSCR